MRFSSALIASFVLAAAAFGQFRGFQAATALPPPPVKLQAGAEVEVPLVVRIRPGYHINSHQPAEEYLIPTRIEWDAAPLEVVRIDYPEAEIVQYDFSDTPLSVFSGEIEIVTVLRAPKSLPAGLVSMNGKLRYQACNDKACLAPATADLAVSFTR
jgi:hypothetical protein